MTASPISDLNPLLLAAECWITVASHSMFMRVFLVSPHRSTTYAHAAYCYRPSSVVCRSVCLSLCHASAWALQKRLNWSRCRLGCELGWAYRNHVLDGVQTSAWERAILRGKGMPGYARRHCRELCKNGWTDLMSFGLWTTRVGPKSMCCMWCTLAPPGKYDWTVRMRRRCGLYAQLPRLLVIT